MTTGQCETFPIPRLYPIDRPLLRLEIRRPPETGTSGLRPRDLNVVSDPNLSPSRQRGLVFTDRFSRRWFPVLRLTWQGRIHFERGGRSGGTGTVLRKSGLLFTQVSLVRRESFLHRSWLPDTGSWLNCGNPPRLLNCRKRKTPWYRFLDFIGEYRCGVFYYDVRVYRFVSGPKHLYLKFFHY